MFKFAGKSQKGPVIQPKLKIGQPGDKYEQEADSVADRVMSMSDNSQVQMQPMEEEEEMMQAKLQMQPLEEEEEMMQPKIQMQPMEEEEEMLQPKVQLQTEDEEKQAGLTKIQMQLDEEEEAIQTTASQQEKKSGQQAKPALGMNAASPAVSKTIETTRGKGSGLPPKTNQMMSNALGADFSHVKIHTDSDSIQMNSELGAQAFTHGSDIYFNKGQYNPESQSGKRLLAHELTHVVQQGASERRSGNNPKLQRSNEVPPLKKTARGLADARTGELVKSAVLVKKGPVTPVSKASAAVEDTMSLAEGLQTKQNGVPEIQKVDPATVGAAVAVTAITYQVLKDLVNMTDGDITYTFDRMRGQKYPNNNKNWEKITNWRSTYWDLHYIFYTVTNIWAAGQEVRLNWEYNGYGLSGIYFTKKDFWDKPMWGGDFTWVIQPLMSTRTDINGHPVAQVKIIVDALGKHSIAGNITGSKSWIIDGEGGGKRIK